MCMQCGEVHYPAAHSHSLTAATDRSNSAVDHGLSVMTMREVSSASISPASVTRHHAACKITTICFLQHEAIAGHKRGLWAWHYHLSTATSQATRYNKLSTVLCKVSSRSRALLSSSTVAWHICFTPSSIGWMFLSASTLMTPTLTNA